ncbi:MAG: class I SAM-dependent methyltransferase [Okeania sp. SIO2F4]|uniref:class I SAM-dependent methyltransferase n=1 Tax=Okeania sp. SIO2F4 TaxID=2607790 RepID=UPI001429A11D|nr:class I SAM-dependent methyltransferase [Okeania sp. SIO2F4]NES03264.1 class I SAM-dependent methyltransferase [Okeania sp. SIO2F4]
MNQEQTLPISDQLPLVTSPAILKKAIVYKLDSYISGRGELVLPCLPGMLDYYINIVENLFSHLGRPMPAERKLQLRQMMETRLAEGFNISATSMLVIQYELVKPPKKGIACQVSIRTPTLGEQYKSWIEKRKPPLFGSHPDARVLATVGEFRKNAALKILDVGGGTGRNALPLARKGHYVDVLELTPVFIEQLQTAIATENLSMNVIEGDILDPLTRLKPAFYQLAIATEVVSHFRDVDDLRLFLAKMSDVICCGGLLLFNIFLTVDEYVPDELVRGMAQLCWSSLFTSEELTTAMEGLPLAMVSNELVIEYERQHLPETAWPPTSWFESWATGRDVFPLANGKPPLELRWILCRRM